MVVTTLVGSDNGDIDQDGKTMYWLVSKAIKVKVALR